METDRNDHIPYGMGASPSIIARDLPEHGIATAGVTGELPAGTTITS